jgi:peptidoglycan/xylan/chitin deacetylase (PgdA/CDA1 family)
MERGRGDNVRVWWLLFAAFGALTFAHFAPFPFLLDWANRDVAMWRVPGAQQRTSVIYLTFDDGPNPDATPALLDVLAAERVRATFFIIDRHLTPDTAPIVRRMFSEGHGVALHSHTRRLMTLSASELAATLDQAAARMEQLTGGRPCAAFRPHGGGRSRSMIRGLRASGRRLVGWGVFLWDWDWFRKPSADRLVPRIARRAGAGSIIVLHDGHHRNPRADRRHTIETVQRLIPALRAKGLQFGTICDAVGADTGGAELPVSTPNSQLPKTGSAGEPLSCEFEVWELEVVELGVDQWPASGSAQDFVGATAATFRRRLLNSGASRMQVPRMPIDFVNARRPTR